MPVLDFISGLFEEDEPADRKQPDPGFMDYVRSVGDSLNPEVVYDTVTDAAVRGATGVYNYVRTTTPRQFAEDAYDVGSAIVRGVADNPVETVVDAIPLVGDIKAYAEDIDQAADLRSLGDINAAQAVAGPSLALAVAGVIPGVGEVRKGNKLASAAENMHLSPALSQNFKTYTTNPEDLTRSQKRNVESYLTRAENEDSAWGARERMRLTGETNISLDRPVRETVSPEALQGETLIPIMGDRSIGGGELRSVQGVPLDAPVRLEGGPMYPFLGETGWASMEIAARGKQRHIDKAAEATGQAPIAMYTSMGDLAMDFNTMHAEAALRQLPALNVRPEAIEAFNAAIREGHGGKSGFRGIPEFPGILDEDALAMVRNEVPTTSAPNSYLRQSLGAAFRRAEFQDQGLPVHQDIVRAITEPDLVNDPVGYSGYSFFRGAPGFDVDVGDHTTYSHRIPKQGAGGSTGSNYEINVGGLDYTVPPDIMFPKQWAEISKQTDKHGKPLTEQMKVGTLQKSHGFEVADQQWVDINMRFQEERRAAIEAKGLLEE